ncbi:uncharacterized protein ACA1_116450 [Acanthamoeba castellanii str. Neff]|uniref:Queuosine 5'-phosphate N-glycosylase/hydrolase n=1 Tax=Acanthamoeba castellanii (strain ATCC 30010 / Neff) TaxID=1257118 RepID=L8H3V0_ACACF|nr:uncharacterized protein ACA1_116450 [Acanthamoeba castellanii str. Neff]ELR20174.1 hypothetical protein ACA1_116450 [Acanthamoeba castellanii str. Neff]
MSAPGPLHPLGTMLQEVLNETGRTLEKEGCSKGLGEWVVRIVKGIPEGPHVAAQFVEKLVATLPGFADKATYKDKEVLILKKAQLLAADLYRHMREPRFDFADIHDVTVFADNVLPAVLRKLGVLELSESLSTKMDANEDLPRGDSEVELRCVAIAACDEIVETWKRERQAASEGVELNSMKLDFYLWAKGKEEGFRSIARHATKDTFYY